MAAVFGCVADDFTGATDIAALLARSGAGVNLRIGIPEEPVADTAPFEIVALKCRTIDAAKAVKQAHAAASWLLQAGTKRLFWKYCSTFDSTPQGNIGPVAEALMDLTGATQTVFCPAFPENGRSVYMGRLFVNGLPLDESPMRDHPLTPMRDANLARLLGPQVSRPTGNVHWPDVARGAACIARRLDKLLEDGAAHVITDAIRQEDLCAIAEATVDFPVITGGSALALDLPRLYAAKGWFSRGVRTTQSSDTTGGSIVLCGSCSDMTRRQVAHYAAFATSYRLDALRLAQSDDGLGDARAWLKAQPADADKIIYATADAAEVAAAQSELGKARAGELVEQAFAQLAQDALANGVRRFVVAGGETSGAVIQALKIKQLTIGQEVAPGVPWCFSRCGDENVAIVLKSGNFGQEDFFSRALTKLSR